MQIAVPPDATHIIRGSPTHTGHIYRREQRQVSHPDGRHLVCMIAVREGDCLFLRVVDHVRLTA